MPNPYAGADLTTEADGPIDLPIDRPAEHSGIRGILAPMSRPDLTLQPVLLVLVVACSVRYVDRHGLGLTGALILLGAAVLPMAYGAGRCCQATSPDRLMG